VDRPRWRGDRVLPGSVRRARPVRVGERDDIVAQLRIGDAAFSVAAASLGNAAASAPGRSMGPRAGRHSSSTIPKRWCLARSRRELPSHRLLAMSTAGAPGESSIHSATNGRSATLSVRGRRPKPRFARKRGRSARLLGLGEREPVSPLMSCPRGTSSRSVRPIAGVNGLPVHHLGSASGADRTEPKTRCLRIRVRLSRKARRIPF
jgi:hypothetical protein